MPNLTISSAATLTGANTASGDLFPLLDVSAAAGSQGSKITRDELRIAMGLNGNGVVETGGYTLTVPANGAAALLGTANNFAAAQTMGVNGAASTPALTLNGTVFSGGSATTTKPLMLLEPSGTTSTGWGTNGTLAGVNAPSGFTGMLAELQLNGVRRFAIGSDGWVHGMAGNTMIIAPASGQNLALYPTGGGGLFVYTNTTYQPGNNLIFDTATGTKIGTGTTQKIGFWNATPVVQQVLATGGGATVDNVITFLQTIGLCKQS